MRLALGPIQYYWPRETVQAFYDNIAKSAVDIVYLGEVVCSRRHEMRLADWLAIAEMLEGAGKQAVLSTQTLLESGADLTILRKITDNGRFTVEANDMGAVHSLGKDPARKPFFVDFDDYASCALMSRFIRHAGAMVRFSEMLPTQEQNPFRDERRARTVECVMEIQGGALE